MKVPDELAGFDLAGSGADYRLLQGVLRMAEVSIERQSSRQELGFVALRCARHWGHAHRSTSFVGDSLLDASFMLDTRTECPPTAEMISITKPLTHALCRRDDRRTRQRST